VFFLFLFWQLLLKGASEHGAKRIRVHVLTDGRDVLDGSSVRFVEMLEEDLARLREKGVDARVASGGGRMYVTMDRYEVVLLPLFVNVFRFGSLGCQLVGVKRWLVATLSIEKNVRSVAEPCIQYCENFSYHDNCDRTEISPRRNNLQNTRTAAALYWPEISSEK